MQKDPLQRFVEKAIALPAGRKVEVSLGMSCVLLGLLIWAFWAWVVYAVFKEDVVVRWSFAGITWANLLSRLSNVVTFRPRTEVWGFYIFTLVLLSLGCFCVWVGKSLIWPGRSQRAHMLWSAVKMMFHPQRRKRTHGRLFGIVGTTPPAVTVAAEHRRRSRATVEQQGSPDQYNQE